MLVLEIDGENHAGWKTVSIKKSIEDIAGTFDLNITNKFGEGEIPTIRVFNPCKVLDNDVPLLNGYVDRVEPGFDESAVSLTVSGRDKAGDLVDCSVISGKAEFKDIKFEEFVKRLADPFGIEVVTNVDTGDKVKSYKYDQGSAIYEFIRKYAEQKQLLVYSDFEGRVIIDQAGTEKSGIALEEGVNIKAINGNNDGSAVFSEYVTKGQRQSGMFEKEREATQVSEKVIDENVPRFRPMMVIQEGDIRAKNALERAKWEATTRYAKMQSYAVEVVGWFPVLNKTVYLKSERLKIDTTMLISEIELKIGDEGRRTIFTCVPPEAFTPLPVSNVKQVLIKSDWLFK